MPALDGLRAFAVVAVLLYHADVGWAKGGYFGVDAFFVLSGFLITSLLAAESRATGRIDLRAFWARRARRLLPALVLTLLAVALYAARYATPVELDQLRRDAFSAMAYVANWNQVVSHQSYFDQFAAPSPLKHTWSLAIEEQFYLLWPLAVFAVTATARRRARDARRVLLGACTALAAASAVAMAVLYRPGDDPSRVYYGTDTRAQSLLAGAALALFLAGRPRLTRRGAAVLHGVAVGAAGALAVIWTGTDDRDAWQYRGGFALAAVLVALVIASVTRPEPGPLGRVLSAAPLRAVGVISYGLYLWHWPVYVFLSGPRTGLAPGPLLAARLGTTFAVATASYLLVERPIRYGAIRGRPARAIVPATAAVLVVALVASTSGPVPAQFRSISAAALTAPPEMPSAGAPVKGADGARVASARAPAPLRVMLVGDSVAASIAPGLAREAAARRWVFWNAAIPGCGLASDVGERWVAQWKGIDPKCVPEWRVRWREQVDRFRPDVVVALLGAQDTFDRRIAGTVTRFDTPEGAALARADLRDAIATLSARRARVVLLSTPYYVVGWPMRIDEPRSSYNPAWIDRFNALQYEVAATAGARVSLLDLNGLLGPTGKWTDTVDGVKVRSFDRMHLSEDGARFVARWLAPRIDRRAPEPAHRPR